MKYLMSACCLFLLLCLQNKMHIILYMFSTFNKFNLQCRKFKLSYKKFLIKILGFEVLFNQPTGKKKNESKIKPILTKYET